MRQIDKLNPWFSEAETSNGENLVVGRMTPIGFQIAEPLYWSTDHDSGELFAPVVQVTTFVGGTPEMPGANTIPMLYVNMPGLCGHYMPCGDKVSVCLN